MRFIKDGLTLALSDEEVSAFEVEWLKATAEKNRLGVKWFFEQWENAEDRRDTDIRLEMDDLSVRYS